MKKTTLLATLLALSALSVPALAESVAVVNGVAIDKADVDSAVSQMVQSSGGRVQDGPQLRDEIKNRLIERELLIQEASRRGIDKTPLFTERLQKIRGDLLADSLISDELKVHPVSDADIKTAYDSWASKMKEGKEVHVRQLVLATEADATKMAAQLKKGGNFEALAKAHSKDPNAKQTGGDLGWENTSHLPPDLATVLKPLGKGQVSAPVQSGPYWFLFKVDDVRAATVPPIDEIKPQIAHKLQQDAIAKLQQDLRAKAKIQ
jgi:peptidyl-prolyl cis-trans isomerase C